MYDRSKHESEHFMNALLGLNKESFGVLVAFTTFIKGTVRQTLF